MSARATFKVPDDVRAVLARSTIDAVSVRLPAEQLERSLYEKVNKVFAAAGGKWNRKSGAHVFDRDPREAIGLAVEAGQALNIRTKLQAFYTPDDLAQRVVKAANVKHGMMVLEPSAGEGALVVAALRLAAVAVVAYDIDAVALAKAVVAADKVALDGGGSVRADVCDFLTIAMPPVFDAVIMNPPFTRGADMAHVTHAWRFVKPGGVLVAIMSPSFQHTNTTAAKAFRSLLTTAVVHDVEEIPAGTFEHTNIATLLVTMRKGAT